ncbi:MAG: sensor domain-containing diguanylate cyclase [Thermoleophilia bacterium]
MKPKRRENYYTEIDVSELELIGGEKEKETSEATLVSKKFVDILDALPFYVLLIDSAHNIHFANKAVRATFQMSLEEITGQFCPKVVHKLNQPYPGCPVQEAIRTKSFCEKEHFADEMGRWLLLGAYPTGVKTTNGLDIYFHTVRDITEEKMVSKAVEENERKYRTLFTEIRDAIFIMDPDGALRDINPAGLELLGLNSVEDAQQLNLYNGLRLQNCSWDGFRKSLETYGVATDCEFTFERKDGAAIIVSINANVEHDENQAPVMVRGIMRDMTRNRELEQKSTVDDLTNLYNHGFFQNYLLNKVRHLTSRGGDQMTVLFLDIDDFKQYNDKHGHQEGDYVLSKVGEAIMRAARDEDIASRYGGEEFTLLLNCDFEQAKIAAERIRSTIEDRCSSFADPRIKGNITVSVGLATLGDDAKSAERLVRVADARMYEAKKRGKNQVFAGEVDPDDSIHHNID